MIITPNGTSIVYEKNDNRISILLPQTLETVTTTTLPLTYRRVNVDEMELTILLMLTEKIFGIGDDNNSNGQGEGINRGFEGYSKQEYQ